MVSRLSSVEVKRRLQAFSKQFREAQNEQREATLFWAAFYNCFGISAYEATIFEEQVKKLSGGRGRIDSFIPGLLIVEHKSRGKDLDAAYDQASEYFLALKPAERPKYLITSDFARIVLHDLTAKQTNETSIEDLPKNAGWFRFLVEGKQQVILEEREIDRSAAYTISKLHEALIQINFKGRDLEVFLTRLLFCLFADDTGIFGEDGQFRRFVESAKDDGSNVGQLIGELFDVLNTADADRLITLEDDLKAFPYINGNLFSERTRIPVFNVELRDLLISCATLDWSGISPAIFGAMFQGVLEEHNEHEKRQATRRELGAHYTSERNILRVIGPLFLDEFRDEFDAARRANNKSRLKVLYEKLTTLKFMDPACGCGNFLVIAYRELRKLEFDLIRELFEVRKIGLVDVSKLCRVRLKQFYGIEIDEAAAHIARVALYITDHQMNEKAAEIFGTTRATIPLTDTPHVIVANALRMNWGDFLAAAECSYVFGNPPFVGYSLQSKTQKEDLAVTFTGHGGGGVLDYVCGWYGKCADYIQANEQIECAFVSTNSITQGEQPAVLWNKLFGKGIVINFAHRTFRWTNEGKGVAAVHCVVIGFAKFGKKVKRIFTYFDINSEPTECRATQINAYLLDAGNILLEKRGHPLTSNTLQLIKGSQATDGGNLMLTRSEVDDLRKSDLVASKYIRKFLGADEFINNTERYCLWLADSTAEERANSVFLMNRIRKVKDMRLKSTKKQTQKLADVSYLFGEIRQTSDPYILIPRHSSESRKYIPIGFVSSDVICGDANSMIPNATLYDFGILTSTLHMAWVRSVCGRIKSDLRYSNTIVYNNFPFVVRLAEDRIVDISAKANGVLEARKTEVERCSAAGLDTSLASMYVSGAMPLGLVKAHNALDKAVDKAYGYSGGNDDMSRVTFLFKLYEEITSLVPRAFETKRKGITRKLAQEIGQL